MEKYRRNDQIIDGELDDNQVMMNVEKGKYFGLNSIGKCIWDFLTQPKSFSKITTHLLSKYEVSEEQCKKEVKEFLDKAEKCGIILHD